MITLNYYTKPLFHSNTLNWENLSPWFFPIVSSRFVCSRLTCSARGVTGLAAADTSDVSSNAALLGVGEGWGEGQISDLNSWRFRSLIPVAELWRPLGPLNYRGNILEPVVQIRIKQTYSVLLKQGASFLLTQFRREQSSIAAKRLGKFFGFILWYFIHTEVEMWARTYILVV